MAKHGDTDKTPYARGFTMPAEWQPHAATWLAWPHEKSDWPGKFRAIPWVVAEMARVLAQGERVRILVRGTKDLERARRTLRTSGVDMKQIDFVRARTDRSWTRDFLPIFVTRPARAKKKGDARGKPRLAAVSFRFDGWKKYDNHHHDRRAGRKAAEWLDTTVFEPIVTLGKKHRKVVLEGGAIDVDGEGTLLATEECLLTGKTARNPELGRGLSEQILRDYLGAEKVIWLGRGIVGDDTGGHIDDFARFVAGGRVVLAQEKNARDANYRILAEARERLEGARDARGRGLDVIPLPMPAPVVFDRQRLPASYANFYIGTAVVLVPTFDDVADRRALGILSELFPDREVVGIHARDFVLGLGTMHCATQQEPLGKA
jgi:agmatine deiminase